MTPQAFDLAAAEHSFTAANTAVDKANTELSGLQSRLGEKQQALNMIAQRRLDGGELESDGGIIHLLTLDIAGLEPLVATARDRQEAACEAQQAAQQQVQQCQQALERAQAHEAAQALEARLHELETLLLDGIAQLHVLKKTATKSIHIHGATLFNVSDRLKRFLATGVLA